MKAYDDVLEPKFKRVALIDTFLDEKFECLNVAEALGKRLFAVRFDTPSSRRGNFYRSSLDNGKQRIKTESPEKIRKTVLENIKARSLE